jgi:hypothetical protein
MDFFSIAVEGKILGLSSVKFKELSFLGLLDGG